MTRRVPERETERVTRRAFTIIEMLVSIGVVGVLLALILPGLGSLREQARQSECSSNLRQIAVGALTYANVSRESLPAAILYFWRDGVLVTRAWDFEQVGAPGGGPGGGGGSGGDATPGALWEFVGGESRIFQCPSFHGASTFGSDPATGYNYNTTYLGAEGFLPGPGPDGVMLEGWANARLGVAASQVRRPSEVALFGDGGWRGGANKFMRAPMNTVEFDFGSVYAGGQAFRHARCSCLVHVDGHVGVCTTPREGALAQPWFLEQLLDFPRNGFLSDDDAAYDPR